MVHHVPLLFWLVCYFPGNAIDSRRTADPVSYLVFFVFDEPMQGVARARQELINRPCPLGYSECKKGCSKALLSKVRMLSLSLSVSSKYPLPMVCSLRPRGLGARHRASHPLAIARAQLSLPSIPVQSFIALDHRSMLWNGAQWSKGPCWK